MDFSIPRDEPPLVAMLLEEAGSGLDEGEVLDAWVGASLRERGKVPFRTVRESLVVGACLVGTRLGLGIDPVGWARALEELWVEAPLRGDALEALDKVEDAGLAWGVVTNLDAGVLARVLEASGLAKRVRVAVCSEEARAYKPHPRPFWMLVDRLGVDAGRCVHVGNAPGEDRAGARAAGFQACSLVSGGVGLVDAVEDVLG